MPPSRDEQTGILSGVPFFQHGRLKESDPHSLRSSENARLTDMYQFTVAQGYWNSDPDERSSPFLP